jgi:hypothetical protein
MQLCEQRCRQIFGQGFRQICVVIGTATFGFGSVGVWIIMSHSKQSSEQPASESASSQLGAAKILGAIKLDYNTIRTIILTAAVVLVLISLPLIFILRNFVTFDALDSYLRVTESVRPKILHTISEELGTGYSKNFVFDSPHADNTMLFYAAQNERVTLSVDAIPVEGGFQPLMIQLNGCNIGPERKEELHLYQHDLTKEIAQCASDEPDLHTLRIALPDGLKKGTTLQVRCLVVVYQRVYERLENLKGSR